MSLREGPVVLIVRDGWGRNPHPEHDAFNAVKLADTPHGDALLRSYPWTLIRTSGGDVGLPGGTMGNSEVGHQNLGAGRVVHQESVRLSKAIGDGTFFANPVLVEAARRAASRQRPVHLLGIASDAGVHGRLDHLYGCLELCQRAGAEATIHLFTDGRDSGPFTGRDALAQIESRCGEMGTGRIASLCGRYYAMDRDFRWQRVDQAHQLLTGRNDTLPVYDTADAAIAAYYADATAPSMQGDEFVTPRMIGDWRETRIVEGDVVIFYNYRGDRPREITASLVMPDFLGHVAPSPDDGSRGFDRGPYLGLHFVTMTAYAEALAPWVHVAYPKAPPMDSNGGQYLAEQGLSQFRCAETEKFPHVTFFFNDYRDAPFEGESRQMAQSPRVATYDLAPRMSADEITAIVEGRLRAADCEDFILVNYANGDMVGHTGNLEAAIAAVEAVDEGVGRVVKATLARGGRLIITADHGNAEQMVDPETDAAHTAHTTYMVECIVVDPSRRDPAVNGDTPHGGMRPDGRLADIFPTVLDLLGLDKPAAMEGATLLAPPKP